MVMILVISYYNDLLVTLIATLEKLMYLEDMVEKNSLFAFQ